MSYFLNAFQNSARAKRLINEKELLRNKRHHLVSANEQSRFKGFHYEKKTFNLNEKKLKSVEKVSNLCETLKS